MRKLAMTAILFSAGALPACAQGAPTTPCPPAVAGIATCYADRDQNGAYILAAMPKSWNGDLIVFAHGGPSLVAPTAAYSAPDLTKYAIAVKLGYGWVASSYRREGYGIRMAASDTDNARRYFVDRIAKPKQTFLHGASYGGAVGAKLLEIYARAEDGTLNYHGAFLNSGLVAGPARGYEFRVDLRAVYQYYCNNLPRNDEASYPLWMGLPADSKLTLQELEKRVDECTGASTAEDKRTAQQKARLANIVGVMGFSEKMLYRHMQSSTLLSSGIVHGMMGDRNPFSNEGIRYKGSADDAALNRDVARFAADPSALADLRYDGEPTGNVAVPVVSIHSINDPQVAVESQSFYREAAARGGTAGNLVQAYTDEPEHTGQSAPEIAAAIMALAAWVDKGQKPNPDTIAKGCAEMKAAFDGPCRYHPDFQPKSFDTKYYARTVAAR